MKLLGEVCFIKILIDS